VIDIAALVAEVSLLQQEARIQQGISDGLVAEVEHLRVEVEAAIAEVEHLRVEVEAAIAEAATMRAWAEEAARAENENAEDARRERAAVVAFLRELADAPETYVDEAIALRGASASIERGEHRRGESAP